MFQIDLVTQCKANDRRAQLKLYQQYCDGMFCVAMRFLQNEADAEDVLQESFIKAFEKLHQFRGEVTFGAWLKRIVVNRCIDFLKSKKEKTVALDESYMQIADDGDWTVPDSVTLEAVKKAIEQLPDTYRMVVQLYLTEGFDHSEISDILEISGRSCRTKLMRGKNYLKEILKHNRYGTGS